MKIKTIAIASILALSSTFALAQSRGSSGISSAGASSSTGAGGPAGGTLSGGGTINGTGGSPGPNTSNALNHGTTGNNLGASQTNPGTGSAGNAVNTPTATKAQQSLGNTDTGILKK